MGRKSISTCLVTYSTKHGGDLVADVCKRYIDSGFSTMNGSSVVWTVNLPTSFAEELVSRFSDNPDNVSIKIVLSFEPTEEADSNAVAGFIP